MVNTSVRLDRDDRQWLFETSNQYGITASDIMRKALAQYRDQRETVELSMCEILTRIKKELAAK